MFTSPADAYSPVSPGVMETVALSVGGRRNCNNSTALKRVLVDLFYEIVSKFGFFFSVSAGNNLGTFSLELSLNVVVGGATNV